MSISVLRSLVRRPMFAATIIGTLTIAIGATVAAFAFIDAVFLTRLPVRDQNALVVMQATNPAVSSGFWGIPIDARAQLAQQGAFTEVAPFLAWEYPFAARDGDHVIHLVRQAVAGNFFSVLGARAEVGRLLRPEDDVAGAPDVVVLSDHLWRREYNADSTVVGRVIYFAREPHRVIGVAPPELVYPIGVDAWTAEVPEYEHRFGESLDSLYFFFVGRLRPGVTPAMARVRLQAALDATIPGSVLYARERNRGQSLALAASVTPFTDAVLGADLRPGVIVLFAAVALVLLIACTNVAGLKLARLLTRAPELAVRRALGASRGDLIAHLLTESIVLAAAGGILGLGLAVGLIHLAVALAPPGLPMIAGAHVDPTVVAFALGLTVLSAVAFGIGPALRGASQSPQAVVRGSGRTVTDGPVIHAARYTLVAAQVALALVVVSGAALLGRTWRALTTTPLGFDAAHLLYFHPDILAQADKRDTALFSRMDQLLLGLSDHTAATPGLGPVTSTLSLAFSGTRPSVTYTLEGHGSAGGIVHVEYALDDYFGVMRMKLLRGRPLTRTDDMQSAPVMVVNRAFAQQAWPGQDAVGQRIAFASDTSHRWWTVVGVVADDRYDDLAALAQPTVFATPRQAGGYHLPEEWYAMRTLGDPALAERQLTNLITSIDPAFGISQITTGPSLLDARLARPRALTALLGALSATALFLTALGLFGVLSAYVRERRRDIAVRSALGASPAQLRALVLGQTLAMSATGILCGLPFAFGGTHALRALVPDVRPPDAFTVVAIAVLLVAVVAAAAYGPLRRIARVDARTALSAD